MENNDKQENRPGKLVAVFTTWDNVEAGFIQSLLQANGIECIRQNLYLATISLVGSGAAPIKILVEEKDKECAEGGEGQACVAGLIVRDGARSLDLAWLCAT